MRLVLFAHVGNKDAHNSWGGRSRLGIIKLRLSFVRSSPLAANSSPVERRKKNGAPAWEITFRHRDLNPGRSGEGRVS